jgi:hypothetical protein
MKKVFTFVLAMTIVITGFAQIKSVSRNSVKPQPAQKVTVTGLEERDYANFPSSTRSIVLSNEEVELSYSTYDWQTNAASRNFTAVWPDGFAVMCYTQATTTNFSDRGTGLAIWDPAVGEWEYTESHAEDFSSLPAAEQKTGFGSISRWGENGLVIAAHSANYCHLFFCEDFRNGSRDFSTVVTLPNELEPTWPAVQCSGENLDIVHVLATQYSSTDPFDDAIRYWRYENGEFTVNGQLLEPLDANHMGGGGSNITCFLPYDPAKPNRVSFVVNDAWVDGKVVISEDNGESWSERVFYQHPGIHTTFGDDESFHYPRWSAAAFDDNDILNVVYEWNGSTGEPASGSYYPTVGGVGFWSETLPKNEMCIGGIGEVGGPFIMDSCYMNSDLYYSEWYWSDALHDPLPEYFGELQILDENGDVVPYDGEMPDTYFWIDLSTKDHGAYNSGIAAFPSIFIDGNRIFAFWSMIAGDSQTLHFDGTNNNYRLFCCMSTNGGRTWKTPRHIIDDSEGIMHLYDEMVYGQVIPYLYRDEVGEYLWYVYQNDGGTGTYVQSDDTDPDDNLYIALKVYVDQILGVEENDAVVPTTTMSVYPNPANGSFTMELSNEADVNIFNAVGQLVKSYKSVKNLNVNLEAGIYFVQSGNQTKKVVVF